MNITGFETNDEMLGELGVRIKRCRLAASLTQAALARKAGVSARTVASIEAGNGATLDNMISVLRALNLAGNVDALVPDQGVRPSDLVKLKKERQRATGARKKAYGPRAKGRPGATGKLRGGRAGWTWGEDA